MERIFRSNWAIIPILAQRLMLNLRKVDYVDSQPVASKLLFATIPPDSKDDLGDVVDSFEMDADPSGLRPDSGACSASQTHRRSTQTLNVGMCPRTYGRCIFLHCPLAKQQPPGT